MLQLQINVTIQNPIRKTAAIRSLSFTHVVTSPYKLCQMSLRMHAFDVHIVIICMALDSYQIHYKYKPEKKQFALRLI